MKYTGRNALALALSLTTISASDGLKQNEKVRKEWLGV